MIGDVVTLVIPARPRRPLSYPAHRRQQQEPIFNL